MSLASPSFSFSGLGPLLPLTVAAASAVVATLDDLTRVSQVQWEIIATDDLSQPSDYTLVTSGPKGSTVTMTSLTGGTAAILACTINGGVDPLTSQPSASMTSVALFQVVLTNGLSVGVVGETTERDPVFGSLSLLNGVIRALNSYSVLVGSPTVAPTPSTTAGRGPAGELKALRFEQGTGSAQSGSVRLLNAASIKMRTADGLADANVLAQSAEVMTIGDGLHTVSVTTSVETGGDHVQKIGSNTKFQVSGNGVALNGPPDFGGGTGVVLLEKATINPSTNPTHGVILYVDSSTGELKARGSTGTVTVLAVP